MPAEKTCVRINEIECKSCGRCVTACPVHCLKIGPNANARGYHSVVYTGSGCIGCGNCYYSCPEPLCISVC